MSKCCICFHRIYFRLGMQQLKVLAMKPKCKMPHICEKHAWSCGNSVMLELEIRSLLCTARVLTQMMNGKATQWYGSIYCSGSRRLKSSFQQGWALGKDRENWDISEEKLEGVSGRKVVDLTRFVCSESYPPFF